MGLVGGAYQAWLLSPLLLIVSRNVLRTPWGVGLPQVIFFYSLAIVLSAILPAISVGGAIGLLTLPLSEGNRGILAFFVMVSSVLPIVFFGFKVLNLISPLFPFCPFLVVAMFVVVLLWMG